MPITIFPFIFIRDEGDKTTIRHERIHIEQQRELWLIPFYILYIWYWLKGKLKGMNSQEAYMNIPFEREAHLKSYDPRYLLKRRKHAWKIYIK